ncbi:MAG TPA: hypothetical protein VJ876_04745 [Bacteroidales bacterium]|nr:hypothetical protein [Bacteroidales bacterium]
MRSTYRTFDNQLLWITIFGVAMAFFESSIVVYLRALYYPEGFSFPLSHIEPHIGVTELIREFFSLVMIVSVAALTARNILQRFAHFLYIFAVWDIFYYVFLKLVLGWPESFFTWDVLFLIPVTWSGPVIAPLIISLIMVGFALVIRHFNLRSDFRFYMEPREWVILLSGALVVFVSFIWDYTRFVLGHLSWKMLREHDSLKEKLDDIAYQYVPSDFNWLIFAFGLILLLVSLTMVFIRNRQRYQ